MTTEQPPRESEPRAEIVPWKQLVCSHLGLPRDRTVIASVPTEAHACYAQKRRRFPSVDHQVLFCFSGNHRLCKYYPDSTLDETNWMYTLLGNVPRRRAKWIPLIGTAIALILMTAFILTVTNGILPSRWAMVSIPLPVSAQPTEPAGSTATEVAALETATPRPTSTPSTPDHPVEIELAVDTPQIPPPDCGTGTSCHSHT